MGNSVTITKKVNFEDIKYVMKNKNGQYLLINTMGGNEQDCLIKNTVPIRDEERIINSNLNNKNITIIIYSKNANEDKLVKKYNQLNALGFFNVYIYPGGLFEWLCLQDIYGFDEFPTNKKELDILKFKAKSIFNTYLLRDRNDLD